jgi:hypothetical protein
MFEGQIDEPCFFFENQMLFLIVVLLILSIHTHHINFFFEVSDCMQHFVDLLMFVDVQLLITFAYEEINFKQL